MARRIHVDPTDALPIWRQIEDGMRRLVAAALLRPGEPVPSVRELAKELKINPATVAKAYHRLSDAGILRIRKGEGTFVADHPPILEEPELRRQLHKGAQQYAGLSITLGANRKTAIGVLQKSWDALETGERENE